MLIKILTLGVLSYVALHLVIHKIILKHVPIYTTCSLNSRSRVPKPSIVHRSRWNKIKECLDVIGDLRLLLSNRVSKKNLGGCQHIKNGEKPYSQPRCERFILKNGFYVLASYVEQDLCVDCSITSGF